MLAFITGATGFVGAALARGLLAQGHRVRALARSSERAQVLGELPIDWRYGDLLRPETLDGAFAGVDVVFHVAGLVSYFPRDSARVWRANYEGTRAVLDAAVAQRVPRLVHTSTIAAVGFASKAGELIDESAAYNGQGLGLSYNDAKHAAEDEVRRAVRHRGLNAVIVCPSVVFGAGDVNNSSTYLAAAVMQRKAPTYVAGAVNVVDVEDVAQGHILAARKGRAGERYILGGENVEVRDFLFQIADQAQVMRPLLCVPVFAAMIFARTLGRAWRIVPINPGTVRMSSKRWVYALDKAQGELGYRHGTLSDTILRTIEDLRRRGVCKGLAGTEAPSPAPALEQSARG